MDDLQRLKMNVHMTTITLEPRFGVSDKELESFDKPGFEITDRTGYHMVDKMFYFRPEDIDDKQILGEEISHYLHLEINPTVRVPLNAFEKNTAAVVIECIGHYGAMTYLHSIGEPYTPVSHNIPADPKEYMDYLVHKEGYNRANKLFGSFNDTKLAELSRMPYREAESVIVRFAPLDFYEIKALPLIRKLMRRN